MPPSINVPPLDIVHDDFTGGYQPDPNDTSVPPNGLLDVENMLPDLATGAITTREGIVRITTNLPTDFEVRSLHAFNIVHGEFNEAGKQYLMAVLRKRPEGARAPDDIQVWRIRISDGDAVRVDNSNALTARTWTHYAAGHWGETINNTYYGGSERDPIYSYKPVFADGTTNPHPWEPDATMGQYTANTWAEGATYAVGDRVKDKFNYVNDKGETVKKDWVYVCTKAHGPSTQGTRPYGGIHASGKWEAVGKFIPLYDNAKTYKFGDVVSYEVTDAAKFDKFPRSRMTVNKKSTFILVNDNDGAGVSGKTPTVNDGYWEPLRGPITALATYRAGRLWLRDSDAGTGRAVYSEPVSSDGFWDATAWTYTDEFGAGHTDFDTGDGDELRAFLPLGPYFLVAKRRSMHRITGANPSTWKAEDISREIGCLDGETICEHDGLAYFVSDQGFFYTDGVVVKPIPGNENIKEWLKDNLDLEEENIYRCQLTSFRGLLWFSMPAGDNALEPNKVLVYDPVTGSFWPQTIASNQMVVNRKDRFDELFIAKVESPAIIYRYAPGGANTYQDDNGSAGVVPVYQDIAWKVRTSWWTFGSSKEQRRLRRIWVMMRASAQDIVLKAFRNFKDSAVWTVTRTVNADPVNYIEGQVMKDIDPHALSLEISGTEAPATLLATEIQTEFRRKRYHRTGVNA